MPIDATVGVAGTNREGLYGIKFTNSGSDISLFESGILTSNVSKGKRNINASLKESYNDTKEGMVLKVGYDAATKNPLNIEFSPSMAVPVIATVTSTTTTSNNAKALLGYAVSSGSNVYGGGKYWKIAGSQNTDKCKDFRGEEIRTADSTITTDARNMNYSCTTDVFGLTWTGIGNAMSSKNVFLETSFFVPSPVGTTGGSYSLNKPCPTATVSFCTPEYGPSQTRVELASTIFRTKTLADVFNAVKERKICVSNDSENVYFWWNPREIDKQLETTGSCLSPITALNARCQ
jgi:hypothetical protein